MYESSDSQFYRTTTGINSGQDFDESMFVMTFFTNLETAGILCSFTVVVSKRKVVEMHES